VWGTALSDGQALYLPVELAVVFGKIREFELLLVFRKVRVWVVTRNRTEEWWMGCSQELNEVEHELFSF
jgi:hypothetical protein